MKLQNLSLSPALGFSCEIAYALSNQVVTYMELWFQYFESLNISIFGCLYLIISALLSLLNGRENNGLSFSSKYNACVCVSQVFQLEID